MQSVAVVAAAGVAVRDRLSEFAAAVLDPARPPPRGTIGPDGRSSVSRFAIYRNNVLAGLGEALKAAFPVVRRIVGDEFFAAMARTYASLDPPQSPVMLDYGAGFPAFIRTFEPAAQLPYLCDVALLERAWVESYHSAEAEPLAADAFATIDPHCAHALVLRLHPSVRIVRSSFPALTIWRTNVADTAPEFVDILCGGEDALVTRPAAEVEVRKLPPGAATFCNALRAGASILRATTLAL